MTSPASPTALVTGASTGLGYAIACGLAQAGYDIAVTSRDVARLDGLLRDPAVQGRKVVPVRLDLRVEADIAQAFAAAVEAFGDIDVLVNNAGRARHSRRQWRCVTASPTSPGVRPAAISRTSGPLNFFCGMCTRR